MIHTKCKSTLLINLNPSVLFLAIPVFSSSGKFNIQSVIIKNQKLEYVLYCLTCNETVQIEDVSDFCSLCHKELKLLDLKYNNSAIVCTDCATKYELMSRIITKNCLKP